MNKHAIEMIIGITDEGKIFQQFRSPMERVEYDPSNMLEICEKLAACAFEARDGLPPAGPALKAELVERIRMTCTQRGANMLNTMRENKSISNGKLAQELVEMVLKEAF